MKMGKKREYGPELHTYFAWIPITIKGETRWLEKVTVKAGWSKGILWDYWEVYEFIDA